MGKYTFYSTAYAGDDDHCEISNMRVDITPEELSTWFTARELLAQLKSTHSELPIKALELTSTAAFGIFAVDDHWSPIMDESYGLYRERGGWRRLFQRHATDLGHIGIGDDGLEWCAICVESESLVWFDAGWIYLETLAIREGLVQVCPTSTAKAIAAGILKSKNIGGLAILADALQDSDHPEWLTRRFRDLADMDGPYAEDILKSLTLKQLAGKIAPTTKS